MKLAILHLVERFQQHGSVGDLLRVRISRTIRTERNTERICSKTFRRNQEHPLEDSRRYREMLETFVRLTVDIKPEDMTVTSWGNCPYS